MTLVHEDMSVNRSSNRAAEASILHQNTRRGTNLPLPGAAKERVVFKNNLVVDNVVVEPAPRVPPATSATRAIPSAAQLGPDATANKSRAMRIAFIGLGRTGNAMAARLLQAGYQLKVYDPDRSADSLEASRWSVAHSIVDACRSAEAVFTMLPDDELAETVILGPGGVVECLPREAIHVGSSVISVEKCDQIVEAHWDAGKRYISAPVLVRTESAAKDELLVIAGGADATIVSIYPVLRAIGQVARLRGWPSDANIVRLGADYERATLLQFLARHPGFCNRQLGRGWRTERHPFAQFLDIENSGVLQ